MPHNKTFLPALQEMIAYHSGKHSSGALLIMEIVNYPVIMNIYSREFADNVIATIMENIRSSLSQHDKIYHIDKTLLAILLPGRCEAEIEMLAEHVYRIAQDYGSGNTNPPLYVISSIGSSMFPIGNDSAEDIFDKAYMALKHSENEYHRYYAAYNEAEKAKTLHKNQMILAHCMHNALINNKLRLAFQPIISSKTGSISHHECLLRIIHDDGRIISVGPFIPVVEKMGFIDMVDELVLDMVVQELINSPTISLAFNISGIGIDNPKWMKKAKALFKNPEVASRAIIEITETALQKDMSQASYFISSLQDMGCQVAIDDFGAGHTSFRQLKALPVDIIKIDGSFIRDIVDNSDNRLFVKTLLDITKGFGLQAIAEFVENGEIAKMLMELKVDYMQGNYFCPAVNYRSWAQESVSA
jgi:EAL domain-containing protein (putative c-di-GMP-specific phosphodiesterase class I)/GGDEF domain-containing protein